MINTVAVLCISVVILFDTDIFILLVLIKGCISLGISFATTEKSLTEAFSPFGKVVHVHISRNATTNKSKGFGYVTFEREEEAQNALTNMNGKMVDQRVIFVDKAGRYTRGV
ncbi:unnamed protein product [Malus baccata var. baccata]